MALSKDLISQFAKLAKPEKNQSTEGTTVTGTAVAYNNDIYVRLDGSEQLTPITSSTAGIKDGDRVTVLIKNHATTVTGNVTDPSVGQETVDQAKQDAIDQISEFEIVITNKLEAETARIDDLTADNVTIKEQLTADSAKIESLEATNATITGKLDAAEAEIDNLTTTKLDASLAEITYAKVEELEAVSGDFYNLQSDYADFKVVTAGDIQANSAEIEDIKANMITTDGLDAKYAQIDFANIGEAAIEKLFTEAGIIEDLVVSEGHITGQLVGVTISGDLIEGNTIKADKLVVLGSDGLYYKLNVNAETVAAEQTEYNSLNGSIITAKSITAEKVAVDDLVAFDATIGGFNLTEGSLYSGAKASVDNTTSGVYLDKTGQVAFGDSANYLKYFKDTDGKWKLIISADSIKLGSSSTTLEDELANLKEGSSITNTVSGEVVDFEENAGKKPVGLVGYGQTRQNLWVNIGGSFNGLNGVINDDGSITLSGTASVISFFITMIYSLKPNSTYTLSVDSSPVGCKIVVKEVQNDGTDYISHTISGDSAKQITFITQDTLVSAKVYIQVNEGQTVSGTYRVMLNEGDTAEPWCPPGLNSVEEATLVTSGKNICPIFPEISKNGVKIEKISDGVYKATGTPNGNWISTGGTTIPHKALVGKRLVFSCKGGDPSRIALEVAVVFYNRSIKYYEVGETQLSFDVTEDVKSISANLNFRDDLTTVRNNILYPQIEIGNEATSFEPPNVTRTPIDLLGNIVSSLPDGTRDELHVGMDGSVELVKKTHFSNEFSASNTGTSAADDVFTYTNGHKYRNVPTVANDALYSSSLKKQAQPVGSLPPYSAKFAPNASSNPEFGVIYIKGADGGTESELISWLNSNNAEFIAPLEDAYFQTLTLPQITMPALPATGGHAWIETNDGVSMAIDLEYWTTHGAPVGEVQEEGEKKYATKAELTVTSDEIKAEVSENYATKSSVTQTADAIRSEVSDNYATKSSVEQTADSIRSEVSDTYTTKSEFDALKIGARNLSLDTGNPITYKQSGTASYFSPVGKPENSEYGISLIHAGGQFILSFDYEVTDAPRSFVLRYALKYTSNTYTAMELVKGSWPTIPSGNSSGHCSVVLEPNTQHKQYGEKWLLSGLTSGTSYSDMQVIISNFKFESGSKETDWTPAPEDIDETYATKQSVTTVEQTVDSLTSTVSSNYTTLNNKFGSYYTKTEVDQKDSSIKTTVTTAQTTADSALEKASTVEQTADGLEVRLTQAEKDVDTAQSTANTAKTNAATAQTAANNAQDAAEAAQSTANTAQTTANNAAKTATNYLKFDSAGLCVGNVSGTLGYNTLIKSNGVDIRNGSTVLSSFGSSLVELGKNSTSSQVKFCGGKGFVDYGQFNGLASGVALHSSTGVIIISGKSDSSYAPGDQSIIVKYGSGIDISGSPVDLNGTVNVNSQPIGDHVISRGNTGEWTWRRWASGCQEAWLVHGGWAFHASARTYTTFTLPWTAHNGNYSVLYGLTNFNSGQPSGFTGAHFVTTYTSTTKFTADCWNDSNIAFTAGVAIYVLDRPWG